ncbi:MAG: L-serine ammonia-lyase, iron-sulfur-dependent subunit beta [Spirochaetaceae bacterium]|nr:L-serine ammonia-lyase, iron-sulfur-dependent subunit beta [Spirochaetaceae bacterium]
MSERTITLLDIFGPVMIGPSSSHTAGVARIAFMARKIFPYPLDRAKVSFHGSLAKTYKGHGSDKAAVAGLLGILPEDERLGYALELAEREGLSYEIVAVADGPERYHPNTAVIELWSGDKSIRIRGASIGGGEIRLQSVGGFEANLDGSLDAILVLHKDEIGVIAIVSHILAASRFNIASVASHRKDKGDEALLVVEVDGVVPSSIVAQIRDLPSVREVVYVPSIRA